MGVSGIVSPDKVIERAEVYLTFLRGDDELPDDWGGYS